MPTREKTGERRKRATRYSLAPSTVTETKLTLNPVACDSTRASFSPIGSQDMQALILLANLYAGLLYATTFWKA